MPARVKQLVRSLVDVWLGKLPSVRAYVDRDKLKLARKLYESIVGGARGNRDILAHGIEDAETLK